MGVKDFNRLLSHANIREDEFPISSLRGHRIAMDVNFVVMKQYYIARKILQYKSEEKDIEEQVTEKTYELFIDTCNNFLREKVGLFLCLDKKGDERVAELKATVKKERWEQRDKMQQHVQAARPEERQQLFAKEFNSDTIRAVFLRIIDPKFNLRGAKVMIAGNYGNEILAEGEALCAQLVHNKYAIASFTGDTDAFAYGSNIVIKSITRNTFSAISLKSVLDSLDVTLEQLQDICILSGIDYNERTLSILSAYREIKIYGSIENLPRRIKVYPNWALMRKILRSVQTPLKLE